MTLGKKNKNGIIIKSKKEAFNKYRTRNDKGLTPVTLNRNGKELKCKTLKTFETTSMANSGFTVIMQVGHTRPIIVPNTN